MFKFNMMCFSNERRSIATSWRSAWRPENYYFFCEEEMKQICASKKYDQDEVAKFLNVHPSFGEAMLPGRHERVVRVRRNGDEVMRGGEGSMKAEGERPELVDPKNGGASSQIQTTYMNALEGTNVEVEVVKHPKNCVKCVMKHAVSTQMSKGEDLHLDQDNTTYLISDLLKKNCSHKCRINDEKNLVDDDLAGLLKHTLMKCTSVKKKRHLTNQIQFFYACFEVCGLEVISAHQKGKKWRTQSQNCASNMTAYYEGSLEIPRDLPFNKTVINHGQESCVQNHKSRVFNCSIYGFSTAKKVVPRPEVEKKLADCVSDLLTSQLAWCYDNYNQQVDSADNGVKRCKLAKDFQKPDIVKCVHHNRRFITYSANKIHSN